MAAPNAQSPRDPHRPPTSWSPWVPVAVWVVVIAILGGSGFPQEQTSRIIGPLLHWLFPDWSDAQVAGVHGWIRKGAHVTEYAVAAILTYRALWLTGRASRRLAAALPTLGLVLAVAAADEARQTRVETRTGSPRDVAIDFGGGVAGLGVAPWLVPWLGGRRRKSDGPREDSRRD